MADITKRMFLSHFRGSPTNHVVHLRRGRTPPQGNRQPFSFPPPTAALAQVPVAGRDSPLPFPRRTRGVQDVT